jgi:alpha/beta superfamily hydrolase
VSDDPASTACTIASSDGTVLAARIDRPPAAVPLRGVAAIAHPHPQFGGDLHNNVVGALLRGLLGADVASVRFNFRGVGASGGSPSGGERERDDYLAALDAAVALDTAAPLFACGYSFGADVALTCSLPAIAAWIVVAPPLRVFADDRYVAAVDARPKHIIAGVHDQHASPDVVRAATAGWRNVHVHVVEMADHFFAATTRRVAELVTAIVRDAP